MSPIQGGPTSGAAVTRFTNAYLDLELSEVVFDEGDVLAACQEAGNRGAARVGTTAHTAFAPTYSVLPVLTCNASGIYQLGVCILDLFQEGGKSEDLTDITVVLHTARGEMLRSQLVSWPTDGEPTPVISLDNPAIQLVGATLALAT